MEVEEDQPVKIEPDASGPVVTSEDGLQPPPEFADTNVEAKTEQSELNETESKVNEETEADSTQSELPSS